MQTLWNYERQMNTAFMWGISKTLDRLYPDPEDLEKRKKDIMRLWNSLILHHNVEPLY